jgi:hypothetical protein
MSDAVEDSDVDMALNSLLHGMIVALGDPSKRPQGCIHLLNGSVLTLTESVGHWSERAGIREELRRFFIVAMYSFTIFCAKPGQMKEMVEQMKICRCANSDTDFIRESVTNLHKPVNLEDDLEGFITVFGTIFLEMIVALDFRERHGLRIPGASTAKSSTLGEKARWPPHASELLPTPYQNSFTAFLQWPWPSTTYVTLISRIIDIFNVELVPSLLISPRMENWLQWAIDGSDSYFPIKDDNDLTGVVASMMGVCHLLQLVARIMFDEQILAWLTNHGELDTK